MDNLSDKYKNLKQQYRQVFLECADNIHQEVENLRPKDFDGEIFERYLMGSTGWIWQDTVLKYLDNIVNFEIPQELSTIKKERNTSNCIGCGTCCKFACSEFSYSELKNKAQAGDNYAKQFVSVFIPYSSNEDVEKIFPEYYDLLKNSGETEYYFYHCPKITKNNQCPDYDNRPQICRDFPDNPIAFLPLKCGFNNWKLKSERVLLKLNAIAEIAEFYKNNIKGK